MSSRKMSPWRLLDYIIKVRHWISRTCAPFHCLTRANAPAVVQHRPGGPLPEGVGVADHGQAPEGGQAGEAPPPDRVPRVAEQDDAQQQQEYRPEHHGSSSKRELLPPPNHIWQMKGL